MPVALIPKKNTQTGKIPLSNELQVGELALNTADGVLFTKLTNNSIATLNKAEESAVAKSGRAFAISLIMG